jgi:SAM-dependent methyltransferase
MHQSSLNEMNKFFKKYIYETYKPTDTILDVGSVNINGSYKQLLPIEWSYKGLDLQAGQNVDIIASSLYEYPIDDNTYKIVISGQCMEHVQDLHKWIKEVTRVTAKSGILCLIAPTSWVEHRHPVDCWRILPDGMRFLFALAGIEPIEIYHNAPEHDCIGIGRKR